LANFLGIYPNALKILNIFQNILLNARKCSVSSAGQFAFFWNRALPRPVYEDTHKNEGPFLIGHDHKNRGNLRMKRPDLLLTGCPQISVNTRGLTG